MRVFGPYVSASFTAELVLYLCMYSGNGRQMFAGQIWWTAKMDSKYLPLNVGECAADMWTTPEILTQQTINKTTLTKSIRRDKGRSGQVSGASRASSQHVDQHLKTSFVDTELHFQNNGPILCFGDPDPNSPEWKV